MWDYWKRKYCSRVFALEAQYEKLLAQNEELRICVSTIKQAEARIDQIIEKHEDTYAGDLVK